jgi:endonuclease/exonuclease/phosphatase family metal-dependent hydrolase
MRQTILTVIALLATSLDYVTSGVAGELKLLAWNVESGTPKLEAPAVGSDPATIAGQLEKLAEYDIVALSEVRPSSAKQFVDALSKGVGETFLSVITATGQDDRLLLAWRAKRLQLLAGYEMHRHGDFLLNSLDDESGEWRHRSPLVAHFKDRDSGVEFMCMVNHLARGDESVRNRQAIGLRKWAAEQKLPVIACGDYNFDWFFPTEKGNAAFDYFLEDSVWTWVRPEKLIDTNWLDVDPHAPQEQRTDAYPDSLLDFVFVSGAAKQWSPKSWVVVRDGDFPDSGSTSDHRPMAASVMLP